MGESWFGMDVLLRNKPSKQTLVRLIEFLFHQLW